jgi:hypothetical protein
MTLFGAALRTLRQSLGNWGYREVALAVAAVYSILSLFTAVNEVVDRSKAAAYHAVLTLVYIVTLPLLEVDRSDTVTLELVLVQLWTAFLHGVDNPMAWHYLYFPVMMSVFAIVTTFRPDDTTTEEVSIFSGIPSLRDVFHTISAM